MSSEPSVTASAIDDALTRLVGLPLRDIDRFGNMLMLGFGEQRQVHGRDGRLRCVAAWALHVQCVWRIRRGARIVLGYRDFYSDTSGDGLDDLNSYGRSRFDVGARALVKDIRARPPTVLSGDADEVGGFSLLLTRAYRLDVFPDHSGTLVDEEHWRMFQSRTRRPHFVVSNALMQRRLAVVRR